MRELILRLLCAAALGWLFDWLQVPVGWLLGPMAGGILFASRAGRPQPLPPVYQAVGQAVLGVSSGVGFPLATLQLAAVYGFPLGLAVVVTGGLSLLNGHLLWRWAGVDRATGFMGSLPGAASSMVAMSDEMGADAVVVAVLQYLRLIIVVFLAPLAVGALFPAQPAGLAGAVPTAALPAAPLWLNGLVLAVGAGVGYLGGRLLRLPSPTFLGPFLAVLPLSWSLPYQFAMPGWLFDAGMLLVGLSIGLRFDVPMARKLGRAALVEAALVVGLIGACLGIGFFFHLLTGVDTMTAVLGLTPGGMEVMVASAVQLGADTGLVLAMQMTRWFIILLAGPWVAVRLLDRKKAA
ncbi:MAG: AbrB family transcriptional regulator [Bacillota bacterium]